jgi:predicted hydrocarbon binding protein
MSSTTPTIAPAFPLLLLETMRDMDRPEEVLEGENLAVSLPRRLGLSDVVYLQIHKFREETKRRRLQSHATVEDLVRLVIRRPDADEIFEEAGRRVARRAWEEKRGASRFGLRLLPAGMRMGAAARGVRRLLRQIAGSAALEVSPRPLRVRLAGCLTAAADPGGAACAFYTGAIAETLTRYTGREHAVQHPHCESRRGEACEWTATVMG